MTEIGPPRAGRLVIGLLSLWLLATLAATLMLDFRPPAAATVHWHTTAMLSEQPLGEQPLRLGRHLPESALIDLHFAETQPPPSHGAREVTLPDMRPRETVLDGTRPHALSLRWYRLPPVSTGGPAAPAALFLPRVVGGPLLAWARPLGTEGAPWVRLIDQRTDWLAQWNRSLMLPLPAGADGRWEVVLGLPAIEGASFALSRVASGARADLLPLAEQRRFWQIDGPRLVSLAGLMLGALALALAWRGQQREAHLLFAAIAGTWSLRNLHFFVVPPADPVAYEWFWWVTNVSVNWLVLFLHLFVLRFLPQRLPRLERTLGVYCAAVTLLTIPLWPLHAEVLLLQHAATVAMALGVGGYAVAQAWRSGDADARAVAGVLVAGTAMAAHDLALLAGRLPPEHVYLLPYAYVLLMLAFQHVLARRHARTFTALQQANARQHSELARQHAELEASHREALASQLESARLRERQQLMRDMHDGLGSSLLSALALLQQGHLSQAGLTQLVTECIDDLRLVIDSLEPIDDDLATLLGTLRMRLAPRLGVAGVALVWQVQEDLPPLPWLDPPSALQVLRIVQELITNALRHASAKRLHLDLRCDGEALWVSFEDDGCGFDPAGGGRHGRGLSNMNSRAASLGAQLFLDSRPGQGTCTRLRLPLRRGG